MGGNTELVEYLLDAGADIERRDHKGNRACDLARKFGHYEIAQILRPPEVHYRMLYIFLIRMRLFTNNRFFFLQGRSFNLKN